MLPVVQTKDIHVYKTLEGSYRAYLKSSHPAKGTAFNAWGRDAKDAVGKLAAILAEKNIPFDLTD